MQAISAECGKEKLESLKNIMNHTLAQLGPRHLNFDEFITLVAETTNVMNGTPLCEVSHDPHDPLPLTPNLLLTNKSSATPPPLELSLIHI